MKAILVDDEPLSLMQLQTLLEREVVGVEVVGTFSDPFQVVETVEILHPDVVFLDIHMPGMSGLSLGEKLQAVNPVPEIVFITGYNQYAVDAFELSALDYIMKPILLDRLKKSVARLQARIENAEKVQEEPDLPMICCFTHLMVQLAGEEAQRIKWRTSKALELFAYLLHCRDKVVSKDTIMELLWPEYGMPKASQHLYTTIYNIRQTLKKCGLGMVTIRSAEIERGYTLSVGDARIDTVEWENMIKKLGNPDPHSLDLHRLALEKYTGDYLQEYNFLWAVNEQERLLQLWLQHAQRLSRYCIEQGRMEDALQVNHLIKRRCPYNEESYFNLMKLYDALGEREAVEEQFRQLIVAVEGELDCSVDGRIKSWYQQWRHAI